MLLLPHRAAISSLTLFSHVLRRATSRARLLQHHLESFQKVVSPAEQAQMAAGGPRNLYVLNLSLDMTNDELERLFSVFGQVTHVCIMAVLDNLGRRRAFVDMATGESARQAINSLSGTVIQGYKMDLSFAIVQRSGGPVSVPSIRPLACCTLPSNHFHPFLSSCTC